MISGSARRIHLKTGLRSPGRRLAGDLGGRLGACLLGGGVGNRGIPAVIDAGRGAGPALSYGGKVKRA